MSSKWDKDRVARARELYGDPREMRGAQSQLCKDVAQLIEGKSVSDFGSGLGHIIPHLPKNIEYLGFDSSPGMVEAAAALFPERKFEIMDLTSPTVKLSKTDTAFAVNLFSHLTHDDMLIVLSNMMRIAKTIIFSMETLNDSEIIRQDGTRVRNQKAESILTDLVSVGFKDVEWQHQSLTYQFTQTIFLTRDNPLQTDQSMIARTTIFKVRIP